MVKVYSLLDRKLAEYGQLLLARNDEAIKRMVLEGVRGSGSLVEKYPSDFDVFCVGEFDVETGEVKGIIPRLLASVFEVLCVAGPGVREAAGG